MKNNNTTESTLQTVIRRAVESDLETIQQFGFELLDFERENWDSSLDPKWPFSEIGAQKYLEAIKEKYTILAEIDGRPVGFLIAKIAEPPKDSARHIKQARLENIFVKPDFQRNGVGAELLKNLKKYCGESGVSRLDVSVLADNTRAVNFYQKYGFSPRSINLTMEL